MNEACRRYCDLYPNDPLDDLTEEDKDDFEFISDPVNLKAFSIDWPALLLEADLASSKNEARRFITAGAVYCDGDKVLMVKECLFLRVAEKYTVVVKVGRKIKRVIFARFHGGVGREAERALCTAKTRV